MKNKVILFLVSVILGAVLMMLYGCDNKAPATRTYPAVKKAYKARVPAVSKPVYQAPKVRPVYTPTKPKSVILKPRPTYPVTKTFKTKEFSGGK